MPELPEVEVIRQGLEPHVLHRTILAISCSGKSLRTPIDCKALQAGMTGERVQQVRRRAKYLVLELESGPRLVIHLGMTGNLGIFPAGSAKQKHDHVCWLLDNDTELRFNDTRRFGALHLFCGTRGAAEEKRFFSTIGPEPLSRGCTAASLCKNASSCRQPVKVFLMDSRRVAGIGNIYANESLFRAHIHPGRPASSLSSKEWKQLLTQIRRTLREAIACGGSTISDFVNASGEGGYFQMNFLIYGKTGAPCSRCDTPIRKIRLGGRATFFCPTCQPF